MKKMTLEQVSTPRNGTSSHRSNVHSSKKIAELNLLAAAQMSGAKSVETSSPVLSEAPKRDSESPIEIVPEINIKQAESPVKPAVLEMVDKPISPEKHVFGKEDEEFESLNSEDQTYEFQPIINSPTQSPNSQNPIIVPSDFPSKEEARFDESSDEEPIHDDMATQSLDIK